MSHLVAQAVALPQVFPHTLHACRSKQHEPCLLYFFLHSYMMIDHPSQKVSDAMFLLNASGQCHAARSSVLQNRLPPARAILLCMRQGNLSL